MTVLHFAFGAERSRASAQKGDEGTQPPATNSTPECATAAANSRVEDRRGPMDQDLARGSNICTAAAGTPATDPPTRKSRVPSVAADEEEETGTGGGGRGRGGHPG